MRYREAFALADQVEGKAIEMMRPEESAARRRLAVAKARTLHSLGEPERARQVLLKIAGEIPAAREPWSVYPEAVVSEFQFGRKDLALEHLARILERAHALQKDDEPDVPWALSSLFPAVKDSRGVDVLWKTLRQKYPDESQSALLARLRGVLDGASGREGRASLARDAEAMLAMIPQADERERGLSELALGCEALDLDELAEGCLKRSTLMFPSAAAWQRMGCFLARKSRWEQAADCFRRACEVDGKQAVYLARLGCMLVRMGRYDEGRALIDRARRLALADESAHDSLLDAFTEHGLTDEARREITVLLRIGEFNSWSVSNACQELVIEAMGRNDYARASALWERRILHVLCLGSFLLGDATVSLNCAARSHQFRAYARLAAGQVDPAIDEARRALALIPGDVELLETVVPKLRALGRNAEADQLATPAIQLLERVCADYPRAAMHHNNLAWLAARCHLDLDRGLEHARTAVAIDPHNVGYLDTLAEVLFVRGARGEAIAIMKRCIALRPQDQRLGEQLRRFEAGGPDGR
jgi:tetratricopeptide (TPR) repeat protein